VLLCSIVRKDWQPMARKFRYWGVICYCGEFQPLKQISSLGDEKRPDVGPFKFICTHSESGAGVKGQESHRDKLLVRKFDHAIQGFKTHPGFLKP
jgi:hypothetical protein